MIGSFIKTPAHQPIEIAGLIGLDFVVIDAEHAPFPLDALDRCILASKAAGIPALVRIPGSAQGLVQQVLDLGGAGIVAPHVSTVEAARAVVEAARFGGGRRGYSNSTRAGHFGGRDMIDHLRSGDANAVVIVQIEDRLAADTAREIAMVEGVDGLFVGAADLAVDIGAASPNDATVQELSAGIARAAALSGKASGTFLADITDVRHHADNGMTFFVIGSDQSALRTIWSDSKTRFDAILRCGSITKVG